MGVLRDNPIIWREAVPKPLRRVPPESWIALGLSASLIPATLVLTFMETEYDAILGLVTMSGWAACSVLIGMMHTARTIVQERVQGTWDALLLTRLRPREIVLGKLLAALLPLWAVGLILLPTCTALVPISQAPSPLLSPLYLYAGAIVAGFSFASIGLYCSMRCSTVGSAQLLAFLLASAVYLVASISTRFCWFIFRLPYRSFTLAFVIALGFELTLLPGLVALLRLIHQFGKLDAAHRGTSKGPLGAGPVAASPGVAGP